MNALSSSSNLPSKQAFYYTDGSASSSDLEDYDRGQLTTPTESELDSESDFEEVCQRPCHSFPQFVYDISIRFAMIIFYLETIFLNVNSNIFLNFYIYSYYTNILFNTSLLFIFNYSKL